MKYAYLIPIDLQTDKLSLSVIQRTDEIGNVWFIPTDPSNSDYQAYLEHLTDVVK